MGSTSRLPFEWCRAPDIGLPAPDIVLFLDIAPAKAKERGGYGEERYEQEELQARVRQSFKRIGEEMQGGSLSEPSRWHVVGAGREVETVASDLWDAVHQLAANGVTTPIARLWTDKL